MAYARTSLLSLWSYGCIVLLIRKGPRYERNRQETKPAPIHGVAIVVAAAILLVHQGCAAVGVTLFGVGAGTAAGTGVSHTLDGIAYKTFTVPVEGVYAATLMTLERMDIPVNDIQDTEDGRKLLAKAADRDIEIELDKLTSRTTRMRVVAKRNVLIRDRATATEIILQTDQTLSENPHLAELGDEPQRPKARAQSQKERKVSP